MAECSLWQPRVVRSELRKLAGLGLPVMATNVLIICLSVRALRPVRLQLLLR
jgi:hypothetical protein